MLQLSIETYQLTPYLGGESASGEGEWGHGAEDGKDGEDSGEDHFLCVVITLYFLK